MMDTKIKYDQARESRYIPFPLLDLFYSPLRLLYIIRCASTNYVFHNLTKS